MEVQIFFLKKLSWNHVHCKRLKNAKTEGHSFFQLRKIFIFISYLDLNQTFKYWMQGTAESMELILKFFQINHTPLSITLCQSSVYLQSICVLCPSYRWHKVAVPPFRWIHIKTVTHTVPPTILPNGYHAVSSNQFRKL